jgi:hypothetical protein
LVDCEFKLNATLDLTGATLFENRMQAISGVNILTLLDSNSALYNNTVRSVGAGKCIIAGSGSKTMLSAHNRLTTLDSSVTSQVTTPYDVVDSHIWMP